VWSCSFTKRVWNGSPHALSDVLAVTKVRAKDTSRWRLPVLRPGLGAHHQRAHRLRADRHRRPPRITRFATRVPARTMGWSMGEVWNRGIKFSQKNPEIAQGIEKAQIYFSTIAICENSTPCLPQNVLIATWLPDEEARWIGFGDCYREARRVNAARGRRPLNNRYATVMSTCGYLECEVPGSVLRRSCGMPCLTSNGTEI
jgi:hypothetical protein